VTARVLWRRVKRDYGPYLPLSPYLFVVMFPFYWMLITTFKRDNDLYSLVGVPFWFKEAPTLEHLKLLHTMSTAMFLSYLIPPSLLFLPLSQVVRGLGFTDSVWSLIVVYPSFTIPFCTWLLMGFVRTVPVEIEESAQLDGCTRFQAFRMIIIPVIVPGIITAGIFAFTLTYQEFIYALTFISASANKTIAYGVTTDLVRGDIFYWGSLMGGALIGSIPVAVVYAFSLDHFIHGLTAGALK
jgi:multiple sugar transport system permease protein